MIARILENIIEGKLNKGKAILIMGARQVGKSTLLRMMFANREKVLWLNGDELDIQQLFSSASGSRLKSIFGNNKIVIIDEAQRIQNIGLRLKLIIDSIPEIQLIVTGSSSFDLANQVNEPLTGRKWEYRMFPLSFQEMVDHHGLLEEKRLLPHRLVYGYYPEIVSFKGEEIERLKLLSDSYLYKDIFLWERIQKPDKLISLLQALAYQTGNQISFNELGNLCSLDSKTVEKYIILLEQAYVIFRVGSFSKNLRNELKNSKKIYFFDNGIRNSLINSFNELEKRQDIGSLWENFLMSERAKFLHYRQISAMQKFWRTKDQNEIDYVETDGSNLSAYEFKWNPAAKVRTPHTFLNAYPHSSYTVIHRENFEDFLT